MRLLISFIASLIVHSFLLFAFFSLDFKAQRSEEVVIRLSNVKIEKAPPKGVTKKPKKKKVEKPREAPRKKIARVRKPERKPPKREPKPLRERIETQKSPKTEDSKPAKVEKRENETGTTAPAEPSQEHVGTTEEEKNFIKEEPEEDTLAQEHYARLYRQENLYKIREAIMSYLTYPPVARRMGWEGTVVVSFVLTPEGRVEESKVERSSGFKLLDRNALKVVMLASKDFPRPKRRVVVEVPIVYRLE